MSFARLHTEFFNGRLNDVFQHNPSRSDVNPAQGRISTECDVTNVEMGMSYATPDGGMPVVGEELVIRLIAEGIDILVRPDDPLAGRFGSTYDGNSATQR